jgi:crotonobetainyl-CoA:carnitine CoA-transferase CaiB-like acyl-CoA transferase
MAAPLEGLKVLELARVLAGPWIGQTLADLGAEVIKVESPEGDDTRHWGPPWIEHDDGSRTAAYFYSCNRGKRSVIADFRTREGRELVHRLAADSDVLIENFKLDGLKKYGLDYDSIKTDNPRLIYCSVTGFGQDGPYAARAGYDLMIQAMGGIMDLTGEADRPPQKMGMAYADIFTGLYGVIAIQAALAQRTKTGQGQHLDMALLDSMVGVLGNQAMNYLVTGQSPTRMGTAHPNIVPYQDFPASDGHLIIACGNDRQFERLCELLGLDLHQDPRFATNEARVENRATLIERLQEETRRNTRDALLGQLEEKGIPAGPINTVGQALEDVQTRHRDMVINAGGVAGIRTPIRFSNAELALDKGAPRLGEDTDEILRELDLPKPPAD